jgi:thioredoxin-related protein
MERRIVRWTLLATVLISVVWGATSWAKPSLIRRLSAIRTKPTAPAVDPIQWQPDLKTAHRESAASGRPILIVVGGPRCVYCRKLESETLRDPSLVSYINTSFVPVHLDMGIESERRSAEILEVTALPTCVVLSPNVDLLGTVEGFVKPQEFTRALHQSLDFQRRLQAEEAASRQWAR